MDDGVKRRWYAEDNEGRVIAFCNQRMRNRSGLRRLSRDEARHRITKKLETKPYNRARSGWYNVIRCA